MDDLTPEQTRAADLYDATREARIGRYLATVERYSGPLFNRARDGRVARDPDAEREARADREED